MMKLPSALIAASAAALLLASGAQAQENFYEGKNLTIIIGFSPGGGSDITGRLIASHLGKHIPGNPNIIPRNMPGAGGIVGMNFVGEAAEPDGLTAYWGTAGFEAQMVGDPALRVDLNTFEFIGGMPGTEVVYVRKDVTPPIETRADLAKVENIKSGGFNTTSIKDLRLRLALELLDFPYQHVTGFGGNGPARAAVQQNTINTYVEGLSSYISVVKPTMVDTGLVIPVFTYGLPGDDGIPIAAPEIDDDIPTLYEYYTEVKGEAPSGVEWQTFRALVDPTVSMQRWLGLSPGSPEEAVTTLREAFKKLAEDEDYLAEMTKIEGSPPNLVFGERAAALVDGALNAPPAVSKHLKDRVEEWSR